MKVYATDSFVVSTLNKSSTNFYRKTLCSKRLWTLPLHKRLHDILTRSHGSRPSGRHGGDIQCRAKPKRCYRSGLTDHTQEKCRYKNAECSKCHKMGHLQSECCSTGPLYRKGAENQHVPHTSGSRGNRRGIPSFQFWCE